MTTPHHINWIVSKDGRRRMRVVKSPVGALFYFEEETYQFDDDEYFQDYCWSPSYISGLYDSAEAAEQAAHTELPWLRGEGSN
jgi:hypothetical protein